MIMTLKLHLRFSLPVLLLTLICCAHTEVRAQSDTAQWIWTQTTSDTDAYQEGLFDATDGSGNIFITGYFSTKATFGSTVLTVANGAGPSMYIVKYSHAVLR